jgi:hypothetical protein
MEREVESKNGVREVGHYCPSPGITSLLRRLTGKTTPKMIPERQRIKEWNGVSPSYLSLLDTGDVSIFFLFTDKTRAKRNT